MVNRFKADLCSKLIVQEITRFVDSGRVGTEAVHILCSLLHVALKNNPKLLDHVKHQMTIGYAPAVVRALCAYSCKESVIEQQWKDALAIYCYMWSYNHAKLMDWAAEFERAALKLQGCSSHIPSRGY